MGSSIEGGLVMATSGGITLIQGSKISGTEGVGIASVGNLLIVEGRNTSETSELHERKNSGLTVYGGIIPLVGGSTGSQLTQTKASSHASASSITSANGNVMLQAQGDVLLSGAQLNTAADKTLSLAGRSVTSQGAVNSDTESSELRTKGATINAIGYSALGQGIGAKKTTTTIDNDTSLSRTTFSGATITVASKLDAPGTTPDTGTDKRPAAGSINLAGTSFNTTGGTGLVSFDAPGGLNFNAQQTSGEHSVSSQGRDIMFQKSTSQGQQDTTTAYVNINGAVALSNQTKVVNVQLAAPTQQTITSAPKKDEQPPAAARTDNLSLDQRAAQLATQPGMAWLGQLQNDPAIKARIGPLRLSEIAEAHKSWNYKQQGLTPEGAVIVAVVVTYFTAGAASEAASALVTSAGGSVAAGTAGAAASAALAAGITSLSVSAATALLNNNGDIGAALKELGSSANVRNLVTAMVTAGVLNGLNLNATATPAVSGGAQPYMTQLGQNLQTGVVRSLIGTAINGGSLEDSLKANLTSAFIDTAAAQGAFAIGEMQKLGTLDAFTHKLAHALAGCAAGAARAGGDGCAAGAIGAAVGEMAAEAYGRRPDTVQFAGMISAIAAAVAGGDAAQINLASAAGANAAANNYLSHTQATTRATLEDKQRRGQPLSPAEKLQLDSLNVLDIAKDLALKDACKTAGDACDAARRDLNASIATYSTPAATGNNAQLSLAGNASVTSERNQNLQLAHDPTLASQTLTDSFLEFAGPQLAGYAVGGALGLYMREARAIYAAIKTDASLVGANGGVVAGELSGTRTVIPPLSDAATTRSLIRENESATILANNGYKVEQNPKIPGSANPDYRVNGEIFDNYAPSTSRVRNAWSEIEDKVVRGQTNNVVVNLADTPITPAALKEQLTNYPIPGLKQVIVIDKSGTPTVIKLGGN